MLLGDKIKQLRKQQKITQEELADKIFVSRQTISNWENNKSYPNMDFIVLISKTFNVTIDKLIKEDVDNINDKINMEAIAEKSTKAEQEQKKIQKNKFRVVLGRLFFFRLSFMWVGALFTSYFYFSKTHLKYIWFPILLIFLSLLTTIPIEMIKKKYQLNEKQDLVEFIDALYK